MRRIVWLFGTVVALAVVGCGGSSGSPYLPASPSTASPAASKPAPATADVPRTLDILSVLSVEHEVDVAAERDGAVIATEKDEGSPVRAGEEMGQLDDRELLAELEKAKDDLTVAQNNVKYKQAERQAKSSQLHRQELLRRYGLSSEADLEQARFEARAVGYEVESWKSIAQSSQAEIRRLQLEIGKTHIRAPFSGVVVRRYVRQGQAVIKGEKCFRVSQLGPLEVEFQVPESSGQRPRRNTALQVRPTNDSSHVYPARVIRVSPTVDTASDSYDVVARLAGPNLSLLRPGMAVHVLWPVARPQP